MMIPNCEGCKYELEEAFRCLEFGIHLATTKDQQSTYPQGRHHFTLMMVNDKGEIIVW